MASVASTPGQLRALQRPRRVDARAVLGLFLLFGATGGSIAFWSLSSDTRGVILATRDVPAGATLSASDLAIARVRVDDAVYQAAVPAEELAGLVGRQLATPAYAQQMLARAQIATRPPLGPDELALTIPVGAATAAGGGIQVGDAVQVLATVNQGEPDSRTSVVLPRAIVYDVGFDERLAVVNTAGATGPDERPDARGPLTSLTLIVTQDQALQLAQARWNGELDVALLPPRE